MKTAIVSDWLPTFGGAEHVIDAISDIYPDAPIYTTLANHASIGSLAKKDILTSSLQKWYRLLRNHQVLLPFMPKAMESFHLTSFDLVISSSHAVGKGIIPPSHATHVCYCHTPMRYAWEMEDEYLHDFNMRGLRKKIVRSQLKKLRRWDLTTAKRVDHFIANSTETQRRIKDIYNRDSVVIHPPVDDHFFAESRSKNQESGSYYLAVGRLVPYKKFDLLIEAANKKNFKLKIIGRGQDESRLKKLAGANVDFMGFVSDDQLPSMYANAKAVLFPQYEDAGVVPLEAQACGTPVIAYKKGGAVDTIIEGSTGVFFDEQSVESITDAIDRFEKTSFDRTTISNHAKQFSKEKFQQKIREEVLKVTERNTRG